MSNINPRMTATRDRDGMAVIGRTLHDLRGVRFGEGEGGGAPAPAAPAVPAPTPTPTPTPTAPVAGTPTQLPDDHPLVKAFNAQKTELADAKKRLNDIDDAQKTEAQKLADKIATLETENTTLKGLALKTSVAAVKGVPAELLSGATEAELNAAADKLLAFKGSPGSQLGGNQRPAGPVSQVQQHEETREDRRKRLAEGLKR